MNIENGFIFCPIFSLKCRNKQIFVHLLRSDARHPTNSVAKTEFPFVLAIVVGEALCNTAGKMMMMMMMFKMMILMVKIMTILIISVALLDKRVMENGDTTL